MKIKKKELSYDEVIKLPKAGHKAPVRPNGLLRSFIRVFSEIDLKNVNFRNTLSSMETVKKGEPLLVLMNHSSFIDLEIASVILKDHPFQIVCTSDGFVGKEWLLRNIGCIPTQKFVRDARLLFDMKYCLEKLKTSVLMYPEASYSFDGTETPLPESLGKCIKALKVPVVMIRTHGAFLRDPLYNMLQKRKTDVTAETRLILTPEDIEKSTVDEINSLLSDCFRYDHFREQQEKRMRIDEPFRADGLNRVLYRCPVCLKEGTMKAKGTGIRCTACKSSWFLDEYGELKGDGGFLHIPDWYRWERECVRDDIMNGTYSLDVPVDICMMVDRKAVYSVGEGRLCHSTDGFRLTGCDGKLEYTQKAGASYSLYSDYYWYELGDMIAIGDNSTTYYCFPKTDRDIVAKTRLAVEELYKIIKNRDRR